MKQETKRRIEISNLHEFADSLILIDNRIERCKKHQASTIVLIAISAVICGADTWNSIEDFGKSKESFFAAKLSNFNGIPSHDTFNRFFSALDPLKFEESYRQWVQSILKCYSGHIAIDGKTIRGAYESEEDKRRRKQGVLPDSNTGKYKLHVISAFATELGISLGQLCTQEKENEIVVIPELLDMLCIKDCIITIDALGCQRTIAEKVIKGEGDYIFIVKDNQPKLKETVLSATESIVSKGTTVRFDKYETHEEGHGSRESAIAATIPVFWEQILERSGKIYGLLDILRIPEIQTKALQWKKDVLYLPWNLMRRRYLKIVENTGKLRIIYIGSWMSISMKTIPEEEIYQH